MAEKHRPLRICIGCRGTSDISELMRCVAQEHADTRSVVVDGKRKLPGRGAWLHPNPTCLHKALRAKAFNRAFKSGQIGLDQMTDLLQVWRAQQARGAEVFHHDAISRTPYETESGSEI